MAAGRAARFKPCGDETRFTRIIRGGGSDASRTGFFILFIQGAPFEPAQGKRFTGFVDGKETQ